MLVSIHAKGESKHIDHLAKVFESETPQEFINLIKGNSDPHTMDHTQGMIMGNRIHEGEYSIVYSRNDNQNIFDIPFFDALAMVFPNCALEAKYANITEESVGGVAYKNGNYVGHYQITGKEDICDWLIKYILASKPYCNPSDCVGLISHSYRNIERNASQSYPSQDQLYVLDNYNLTVGGSTFGLQLLFDEVDKFYSGMKTDLIIGGNEFVLIEDSIVKDNDGINYKLWELLDKAPVTEYIDEVPLSWSIIHSL